MIYSIKNAAALTNTLPRSAGGTGCQQWFLIFLFQVVHESDRSWQLTGSVSPWHMQFLSLSSGRHWNLLSRQPIWKTLVRMTFSSCGGPGKQDSGKICVTCSCPSSNRHIMMYSVGQGPHLSWKVIEAPPKKPLLLLCQSRENKHVCSSYGSSSLLPAS